MSAAAPAARRSFARRHWKAVLGILVSVGLLYLTFRGEDLGEIAREIGRADPLLLLAAVAVATLQFAIRAWRWKPILDPVQRTSFHARFAATSIGFMANNLLPARIGEFARAVSLARLERLTVTTALGSLVIERIFDGITIIAFLFAATAMPTFPVELDDVSPAIGTATTVMMIGLPIIVLILAAMVLFPRHVVSIFEATFGRVVPERIRIAIVAALHSFTQGLGALRSPGLILAVLGWSIVHWLVGALSYWLAMFAFGIDLPFTAALFLQSLVSIAVAAPSAPGFFGVYEFFFKIGLANVWGVPEEKVVGCAIGFHIGGFIPITILGLYYASKLGISWREVEHSEKEVAEAAKRVEGQA